MSHTTWDEKVQRGRHLVKKIGDHKWELGDLANEVCPIGSRGISDGGGDVITSFANEIGLTERTLRTYRQVAAAFPNGTRAPFQTWTTHRMLAERDDRFDIINEQSWTYNSLSERLGRLPNPSRVNKETGEILDDTDEPGAEQDFHRFADSPEAERFVRDAIKSNPGAAQAAMKALDERYDDSPKPISAPNRDREKPVELIYEFRRLHKTVDYIVQLVNEGKGIVSDSERDAVLREVQWLRTALGYIEDGVSSNSLEHEIAEFLGAQS